MEIRSPTEPVYYYECSAGDFRLTYFIPPEELDRLIAGGKISAAVTDDFPDGVDLDCTEPDFAEFEGSYGTDRPRTPSSCWPRSSPYCLQRETGAASAARV